MKNKLKRTIGLVMAAVMLFSLTACGGKNPDAQVAKVNDTVITQGQLDTFSALYMYMLGYDPAELTADQKQSMLEDMVDTEVIRQYYDGLETSVYDDSYSSSVESFVQSAHDSEADFLQQYEINDQNLEDFYNYQYLTQAFFTEIQSENADKDMYAQASEYYDDHLDDYKVDTEVRASVILVKTEDEAKDLVAQLDGGADFAQLAKDNSQETNSAANGGDMGYFTEEQMSADYSDAVFALEVGQYTEPMQTEDGYAIIKITDRNDTGYKPLDEVLQDIYYTIYEELYTAKVDSLKNDMTIDTGKAK